MTTIRDAYVIGGNRIPFARSGGAYLKASNQDMLTAALDGLVSRFSLSGERLGEGANPSSAATSRRRRRPTTSSRPARRVSRLRSS